jgi:4'-phosphopantetheinyl transferase
MQLDTVEVRSFSLAPVAGTIERLRGWLSADELARAERFVTQELRDRFVVCRGRLREWLAEVTNQQPDALRLSYEASGKPYLADARCAVSGLQLHFNVSHSADRALIALAPCQVGIDIEVPNRRIRYETIATQLVSGQEQEAWDGLPTDLRVEQFLRLWVCKEAWLKAVGIGIAGGLKSVAFKLPIPESGKIAPAWIDPSLQMQLEEDATCARNDWLVPSGWSVQCLPSSVGGRAAIASLKQVKRFVLEEV